MRILPLLILYLFSSLQDRGKSPHGPDFSISCNVCHGTKNWLLDKEVYSFNHDGTSFPLQGEHKAVNCRQCHQTLVFKEANTECSSCHTDIHQATVGQECSRCHTPVSWLVGNITEMHMKSRFPLLGAHKTADCVQCHKSESAVRFDVQGINCIDCHLTEYNGTTKPNHSQAGFTKDCITCHSINAMQWEGAGFNHSFFPLTGGHNGPACIQCHKNGNYTALSKECYTCHITDYNNTSNPRHSSLGFPQTCNLCHTLDPGWKPASYKEHDSKSFPIYSGNHKGEWNTCADCHTNPSNYTIFTCFSCHEHNKTSTDREHGEVRGYTYDSNACYRCHPRGSGGD